MLPTVLPAREPMLMDRWIDADLLQIEMRQLKPEMISQPEATSPPDPFIGASQFALFVALVLATASVVEVVTVRHRTSVRHRRALGRESRRSAASKWPS